MKLKFLRPVINKIVPPVACFYISLMGYTSRLKIISPKGFISRREFLHWPDGVIYSCWHSRLFYLVHLGRRTGLLTMVSKSKDGQLMSDVIKKRGMVSVRGSSSKGGRQALEKITLYLKKYSPLTFMAPDGPRGPVHKVKPGVIKLAQDTGKPILPMCFCSTKGIFFGSWDKFLVPLPFGKAVVVIDEPFTVPKDISKEEFERIRINLENTMNRLRDQVDRICKRDPEKEAIKSKKKKRKQKKENK